MLDDKLHSFNRLVSQLWLDLDGVEGYAVEVLADLF